ncbi:methyltransferase [Ochrobactrum sp. SFR4]|uniref:methyltransferase n=1 Tax=Ochrobactrum sp. SFR4 TaxID=2717368 RepID=UPI001C8B5C55|nr:methyltransferase [Ochrobactrum sp. SFR4]MBX8825829.1 methyltransferase domain-containing protein [Ochrobactrum sp. SFR4]
MARAFFSSGDLIADRRAHYAVMMSEAGDHSAAADLMRQSLDYLTSQFRQWPAGLFMLSEMHENAGETDEAVALWRQLLKLDPEDRFGAGLKLAQCGLGETPDAAPPAYIEALFDAYAPDFEESLVDKLQYCGPQKLAGLIARHFPERSYQHVLDLGCGTGLMGEEIHQRSGLLSGADLSEAMLKKADEKQIYTRLIKADVNQCRKADLVDEDLPQPDMILAADVFIYIGQLERAFALAAECLRRGGVFAFSVETHDRSEAQSSDGSCDDMILQPSLRFTHSARYIENLLQVSRFELLNYQRIALRLDRGEYLDGYVFIAQKC